MRAKPEEALGRLEAAVSGALEETGMTEDKLAGFFDLNKPFPVDEQGKTAKETGDGSWRRDRRDRSRAAWGIG